MADTYKVVVTDDAKRNLREIIEYLVKSASLDVAKKVRDGIEEEIAKLAHMHNQKHCYEDRKAKYIFTVVL